MPLGERWFSGARDAENARPGESRYSHNHSVRVCGSCGRDVEAGLVARSDIHKVAERVVSLIFGTSQALDRIGPDIYDGAVRQFDEPMTWRASSKTHALSLSSSQSLPMTLPLMPQTGVGFWVLA